MTHKSQFHSNSHRHVLQPHGANLKLHDKRWPVSDRTYFITCDFNNSRIARTITSNVTYSAGESIFVRITVAVSNIIASISNVVGWIYFAAWSISFYPQIYTNFKRKSVVGLNFDFVALNIVGFVMYTIFNAGLYWIPEIEQEYFERHPRGLNPVLPNDVGFGVHAIFATLVTIIQCFFYEVIIYS